MPPKNSIRSYHCKDCFSVLKSADAYFQHYRDEHSPVPCSENNCTNKFATLNGLRSHLQRHHTGTPSSLPSSSVRVQPVATTSNPSIPLFVEETSAKILPLPVRTASTTSNLPKKLCVEKTSAEILPPPVRTASLASSKVAVQHVSTVPPPNIMKDDVLKFYLELEGLKIIPSKTVQYISEKISSFSELSHLLIKASLLKELLSAGVERNLVLRVSEAVFKEDIVYNMHHKGDPQCIATVFLRREQMKKRVRFVPAIQVPFEVPMIPSQAQRKGKTSQYVPIGETLTVFLNDSKVKKLFLKSFDACSSKPEDILEDFTDGSAFKEHLKEHKHKCVQILLFQDALEYNPFGPAKGLYKTVGMYYVVGNVPAEYRSKLDKIMLASLFFDKDLKPSEQELLDLTNKHQQILHKLIKDLQDLREKGISIDGVTYPVCLIFALGDNLGQHQIASYVQSFTGGQWCRYCPITKEAFLENPHLCEKLRTSAEYDDDVAKAREKFLKLKEKALKVQQKKRMKQAEKVAAGEEITQKISNSQVSKNFLKQLQAVNSNGVKPVPSVLNQVPGFHVNLSCPPCLAHDLFEGIVDTLLAKILEKLISKGWFDLDTLNRRITSFKYKGQDALDAPNKIRSFEGVKGHACETWTLLRLLPLIIEDLIKDPNDEHWLFYLQLKEVTEYVCAPRIRLRQVSYLDTLIKEFLTNLKRLFPECLTPKGHYLGHYCALILIFGPLIRLFTLRFEGKHVFFKSVAKICHNYVNLLLTLAQKYQYRFALDSIDGFLENEVVYDTSSEEVLLSSLQPEVQVALQVPAGTTIKVFHEIEYKGTSYINNMWLLIDKVALVDLEVGRITKIFVMPDDTVFLKLEMHTAESSGRGYYVIKTQTEDSSRVINIKDLPDHFPLPSYLVNGKNCIVLKHSTIFM